jgi:fimbrial isopeptide formation D2 family protein
MVKDDRGGHRTWWWMLLGAAGLALMMTAILLWPSTAGNPGTPVAHAQETDTPTPTNTPTATHTPAPTATPNEDCDLRVTKNDDVDPVAEGGEITYTITVRNEGDGNGHCTDLTVTDTIPTDTDCSDATDDGTMDFDISGCDTSGDVTWDTNDNLDTGDEVVITMVVELTSGANEGDTITNDACATSSNDEPGDCDTERTKVGEPSTATPTTAATTAATPYVPPPVVPPVIAPLPPVAAPAAALIAPATGSGADSEGGSSQVPALALGLAGGLLLLLSGAAMLRRPR